VAAPTPKQAAPPESPPSADGHELRMGIMEHLVELRNRLTWAFLAFLIGAVIGFAVAGPVLEYLITPYADLFPETGRQLIVLGPTGAVVTYLRVSLLVGGIVAVPMSTYQIMRFIVPGLTRKEKRYVMLSIPAVAVLFVAGVAFSWFVLMPPAITFLEGFQDGIFAAQWEAGQYITFVTALLFWMGVAFQTPLVFFMLSLLGVVSAGLLIRSWRIAIVISAVAAAFITPTVDPVNMFLVMGPLLVLYLVSIILTMIGWRIGGHHWDWQDER